MVVLEVVILVSSSKDACSTPYRHQAAASVPFAGESVGGAGYFAALPSPDFMGATPDTTHCKAAPRSASTTTSVVFVLQICFAFWLS
jgi:hypothetical protein